MKTSSLPSSCTTRSWNVNGLLDNQLLEQRIRQHRRHFHQLFCQLRLATQPSQRNIMRQDLGHFDNRLGNHWQQCGKELHDIRQLFSRLRHRDIETMDHRAAPSSPAARAPTVPLAAPPGGPAIVRGEFIVLGRSHPGVGRPLAPWSVVHLRPCTSERRVVQGCGQLHAYGHPLVSKKRAEPALPPPPCGADMGAISKRAIRWVVNHHGHTNKETRA